MVPAGVRSAFGPYGLAVKSERSAIIINQERRTRTMKPEDLWMIGIVAFCILFTATFGWGLWG
jgi:hypothetical protein